MASESNSNSYRLPPLPNYLSSWNNPFDLGDRANIRYESAASHEHEHEQEPEPGHKHEPPVGLGISDSQPSPSSLPNHPTHSRTVSYDDTATLGRSPSNRASSRFAGSDAALLGEHSPPLKCPTTKTIVHRRLGWVPVTILVLGFYSTLVSGLYLVVAFLKPRYGKGVGVDGKLAPSTASLLSTLFAKTVELAYVTVCVAFLGQVLTRRAITRGSKGISIADMSMRTWIMQPGSMIVHWESLRYSGWTILGAITLTATIVAMLYTTAAEALVTPKLRMGPFEDRMLVGDVHASFANTIYLANNCQTPVALASDSDYRNLTCLDMQHAGQAYHNYQAFLHAWSLATEGNWSSLTQLSSRPRPVGSVNDNTTMTGSWIEMQNMTALSEKYGRIVHNVTAAMPHGGIIGAANHPDNDITQPRDRSGEGNYDLDASVPSPAVNVLCVGMTKTELKPIVYDEWPNTEGKFDPVTWTTEVPGNVPPPADWHNRTVVDDIFGFGPDYPGYYAPIFGKLPKPHNTILNVTGQYLPGAIYLLGAAPEDVQPPYVLCSLRAKQSPACSTQYKATATGSELSTRCEDGHSLQYNVRNPDTPTEIWTPDWKSIASEWAFTISLNAGITDGASMNARLLMQFFPKTPWLDPNLPSISEALAVLAGNTLLMSSQNAPFVHFWNYTAHEAPDNILPEPVTQSFNATLRSVEYASGGTQRWQGIFYPILIFAFITSALCLAFLILEVRGKQITDFTEPQNLFALAMNSPSTSRLQGACGSGPEGRQLKERWYVAMEEHDEHYYIQPKAEENTPRVSIHRSPSVDDIEMEEHGPLKTAATSSPAMDEYRRLSSRKSWVSRTFY
ncbi:hypothetical protein ASPCAL04919 [Aspergillus calidoustus]|uniref:Uncharacterized protein n=1 Tax=Aspergillus calidoustus TaxID=454130 RepID=A0A0U5FW72_ASPCI|nr:hypothetical protein ASPCAL04919 [Aspergillus calidoustus]